jgi:hypothetical protein
MLFGISESRQNLKLQADCKQKTILHGTALQRIGTQKQPLVRSAAISML